MNKHYGCTPLHLAVIRGHKHVVAFLLHRGADPEIRSMSGTTAYDMAYRFDAERKMWAEQLALEKKKNKGNGGVTASHMDAPTQERNVSDDTLQSQSGI